ncbi:hypothetical protein D3Z50_08050 [Clostridiaceae bacterium]|nr:hypothetical protein [Clostridiaceae bacterium]
MGMRRTMGGVMDETQTTRVMYGLNEKGKSYFTNDRNLQKASEEKQLPEEQGQKIDYTKFCELREIDY